ncbi:MAG TPA: helix-turn-helix domain-containing protein [Candidatus Lokiarchaeia archaeon]
MQDIIKKVEDLFNSSSFEVFSFYQFQDKRNKYCFDFLVKKEDSIFLVKVFPNIDNLNKDIIKAIKDMSLILKSKPLLIGIKNRYQNLDDDTIYIREDLPFITLNTLENIFKNVKYPYVLSQKGGKICFINGDLLKTLRENKNISRKEMADKIGITKRTLCSYENESMRPTQDIAEKILNILESQSVLKKINLMEWHLKLQPQPDDEDQGELNIFESHLQNIFEDIGVLTYWHKKGQLPFELTLSTNNYESEKMSDFYPLFSGVSQESDSRKITKINLNKFLSFAKIFQKNALFIIDNEFKVPEFFKNTNIPIIKVKKLEKVDNEKEFKDLIQEN